MPEILKIRLNGQVIADRNLPGEFNMIFRYEQSGGAVCEAYRIFGIVSCTVPVKAGSPANSNNIIGPRRHKTLKRQPSFHFIRKSVARPARDGRTNKRIDCLRWPLNRSPEGLVQHDVTQPVSMVICRYSGTVRAAQEAATTIISGVREMAGIVKAADFPCPGECWCIFS